MHTEDVIIITSGTLSTERKKSRIKYKNIIKKNNILSNQKRSRLCFVDEFDIVHCRKNNSK